MSKNQHFYMGMAWACFLFFGFDYFGQSPMNWFQLLLMGVSLFFIGLSPNIFESCMRFFGRKS